jgi:hypothetical protein
MADGTRPPDRFTDLVNQIGPTLCAAAQVVIQIWLLVHHG